MVVNEAGIGGAPDYAPWFDTKVLDECIQELLTAGLVDESGDITLLGSLVLSRAEVL